MKLKSELSRRTLHFRKPARTSRGEYTEHRMLLVRISDGIRSGVGECAPLPDLSCDRDAYHDTKEVSRLIRESLSVPGCAGEPEAEISLRRKENIAFRLEEYPALRFAVESALAQMERPAELYDTPFARGESGIPVNGLVWMAGYDDMLRQSGEKLEAGFRCIKFKIGAIRWEEEIQLIRRLRSRFGPDELQIRVDANGAFKPSDAPRRLDELSALGVHSIEQPIMARQWKEMERLCRNTPLPIALDEELTGLNRPQEMKEMLEALRPQYIVVKPTLHGGLSGTREWIEEASRRGIGSWITSALESNIGLKSIALLTASIYRDTSGMMPQGLGTGLLYTDNIDNGIELKNGTLGLSGRME